MEGWDEKRVDSKVGGSYLLALAQMTRGATLTVMYIGNVPLLTRVN